MSWQLRVGTWLFSTVSWASQVETFPFTSVTVSVTVWTPTSIQSQLTSSEWILNESIPQLSFDPPSISAAVRIAVPVASNWTVMSWQIAVGLIVSSTTTSASHVLMFPFTSVTVSVTVFVPTWEQSKSVVRFPPSTVTEAIPQLSVEPPSISIELIVTSPFASSWTVMFWQTAVGSTLSSTVTVASQVETFPFTSVTVSVTVFVPTWEQSKSCVVFPPSIVHEAIPQLSIEPPSISIELMVTSPLASNWTVMFWQIAVGDIVSSTVTSASHVLIFPLTSVTVKVIVLTPTWEQSKLILVFPPSTVMEAIPQFSVEPPSMSTELIETTPPELNWTIISWQTAVGVIVSSTVTIASQVLTFPFTSVTVSVTVFAPTSEQSKLVEVCPPSTVTVATPQLSVDPPSMSIELIVTSPLASSWTVMSWQTAIGFTVSRTVTTAVQVELFPLLSTAVNVTVFGPMFEQSNASGVTVNEANPQLAFEPPFTSSAIIPTFPVASK